MCDVYLHWNVDGCSASSVARGAEEYAKYSVFSTFEADFCTEKENSPPHPLALAMSIGQGPDVISTRKTGF